MYSVFSFSILYLPPQLSVSYSSPKLNGANILSPGGSSVNYDLFIRRFSQSLLYSTRSALNPGGALTGRRCRCSSSHSSLYMPRSFFAATLYSTRRALFLIVFLESKVVKSMIHTPIYSRPTRAPRPNAHIWPHLAREKGSKSAFFNGEVESSRKVASPMLPIGTIRIRIAQCGVMPQLHTSARRLADISRQVSHSPLPLSHLHSPSSFRPHRQLLTARRVHPLPTATRRAKRMAGANSHPGDCRGQPNVPFDPLFEPPPFRDPFTRNLRQASPIRTSFLAPDSHLHPSLRSRYASAFALG